MHVAPNNFALVGEVDVGEAAGVAGTRAGDKHLALDRREHTECDAEGMECHIYADKPDAPALAYPADLDLIVTLAAASRSRLEWRLSGWRGSSDSSGRPIMTPMWMQCFVRFRGI